MFVEVILLLTLTEFFLQQGIIEVYVIIFQQQELDILVQLVQIDLIF